PIKPALGDTEARRQHLHPHALNPAAAELLQSGFDPHVASAGICHELPPSQELIRHRIDRPSTSDTVAYPIRYRISKYRAAILHAGGGTKGKERTPMNRQQQVALLKRLLHYVDTRTTALADAPWCNDVTVYTDPGHLARERQFLFRQHPILIGFASEWA